MSLLLNIDTAMDTASVCLAKEGISIAYAENNDQKNHSAWLHTAVIELLQQSGVQFNELTAVGVSIGPGSYTGLRVGLAAAKGFCYALGIPLITINTLEMLAAAVSEEANDNDLICPMIDARRNEVFTAVYEKSLHERVPAHALVLEKKSFDATLSTNRMIFCGNGSDKFRQIIQNEHAYFSVTIGNASHLGQLSYKYFLKKKFTDLAYSEPLYLKEFHGPGNRGIL
jgi:tRNA threonylcarbamoyladenosine biosynthesis protein TsaB